MTQAYQLRNIKFYYDKTLALSLTQLNIQAGKITALVGPNGCGKSTLLNLLAFIEMNQQGSINFFSELVSEHKTHAFSQRIALLPQKPYMLKGSVADNLHLTLKFHNTQKKQRLLQIASILEKLNIAHLSQQQAKTLSGGELQKVALARALIINPDVLLMDEPFSYLDPGSEVLFESVILDYINENNKTLIFSTHNRLQGRAIADQVISLINGEQVKTPLINLFQGTSYNQVFNTGKIKIILPDKQQNYLHVSIDPHEIVLSKDKLNSSMRNQYPGKVIAIADEMGKIRITVSAGEIFQVIITTQAFKELEISIAQKLWINFKSNSIMAF